LFVFAIVGKMLSGDTFVVHEPRSFTIVRGLSCGKAAPAKELCGRVVVRSEGGRINKIRVGVAVFKTRVDDEGAAVSVPAPEYSENIESGQSFRLKLAASGLREIRADCPFCESVRFVIAPGVGDVDIVLWREQVPPGYKEPVSE
jgi:hypothetical protein